MTFLLFCGLEYTLLCRDVFITNLLLLRALCVIIEGMQIRLGIDKTYEAAFKVKGSSSKHKKRPSNRGSDM